MATHDNLCDMFIFNHIILVGFYLLKTKKHGMLNYKKIIIVCFVVNTLFITKSFDQQIVHVREEFSMYQYF